MTSFGAIEAIKTVSEKFKISETFIGAVFLSVGTSFPEFINSIYAGIKDRITPGDPVKSVESFYNITGANIGQILFLSIVIAGISIYRKIKKKRPLEEINTIFGKDSYLSGKFAYLETTFLIFIFLFPVFFNNFTVNGFSLLNVVFLGMGIFYISKTYKDNPTNTSEDRAKYFLNTSKLGLGLITLALGSLFGAFSCINFYISSTFPIDPSTSFGVILSFVTSSPEFSVMYFLFKQREFQMAVSGFFGSSLFNLSLPFGSNLISLKNIFGKAYYESLDEGFSPNKITLGLILNLMMVAMFIFTFGRKEKGRTTIVSLNALLILTMYVVVSFILATSQ